GRRGEAHGKSGGHGDGLSLGGRRSILVRERRRTSRLQHPAIAAWPRPIVAYWSHVYRQGRWRQLESRRRHRFTARVRHTVDSADTSGREPDTYRRVRRY